MNLCAATQWRLNMLHCTCAKTLSHLSVGSDVFGVLLAQLLDCIDDYGVASLEEIAAAAVKKRSLVSEGGTFGRS